MRGVHSAVDDIRVGVFKEVAKLAYEGGDLSRVDLIPYEMCPGEEAKHRYDVFLERAIIKARVRLALGMNIDRGGHLSTHVDEAVTDQKYFEAPLVNVIHAACNACPPKEIRISDNCQGCISHPCMNVCPKDAIYLDKYKHCHIDQDKCIKCGKCVAQCPYRAISKLERPCAVACGMDAIGSDEKGRAKIDYDKCVSCGMCLVNCPFGAIADKSQIFQLITAMKRSDEVIACVAPAFVGQFGKDATPGKLKAAMRQLGFSDVVEVAIGADLCTIQEANDFLEEVPAKQPFMGTSCCPAWSVMAKKTFPQFKDYISMALTPMVITARMVKQDHPNARICFIGPCSAKKLEANRRTVRSDVDFVLTFEELLGMFEAKEINFAAIEEDPNDTLLEGSGMARGFAVGGGVAAAVVEAIKHIDPEREVKTQYGDGLRECRKMLMLAKAGKYDGYLLEGMACPGGCVAGAGTIRPVKESANNVAAFKDAAAELSCVNSPFKDRLDDVLE
ncbi:MAG: 4Fe-4S dicluster domain-containing protein [Oscillibacter sp.]|nr:4Fe-4S dicluster domain-containing protein [Oscillibacter sp.]